MRHALWIGMIILQSAWAGDLTLVTNVWPPYVMPVQSAQAGYAYDLVQEIGTASGLTIHIKVIPKWDEAMAMVAQGKADGIFPLYKTHGRLKQLAYTDVFFQGNSVLYKRKASSKGFPTEHPEKNWGETFKQMSTHTFGVVKNYANLPEFDDNPDLKRSEVNNDEDNLQALLDKKVDFIFIDKMVAQYWLQTKLKAASKELVPMHPGVGTQPLFIAIRRDYPDLEKTVAALNQGIKKVQVAKKPQQLMMKYLPDFMDPDAGPVKH